MDIRALKIGGSFEITPRQFPDDRGVFLESFRGDRLAGAIGHRLDIIQTNVSVSSRGTVRGVHFADLANPLVKSGYGVYMHSVLAEGRART